MSNPFTISNSGALTSNDIFKEYKKSLSNTSSFKYSESEEFSDSIIENDFEYDINLGNRTSGYSKLLRYQRSSICIRQSLNEVQETIENLNFAYESIKNKINIRDSEISSISSRIKNCSTEIEEATLSIRESKLIYNKNMQTLQSRIRISRSQLLENELSYFIKVQELSSLRDYHKSLQIFQNFEKNDLEYQIKIAENRKKFKMFIKGKLTRENECNSLYYFLDKKLKMRNSNYFNDLIQRFEVKNKYILLSELKLWSSTRIFQSMKMKILDDYNVKVFEIKNRTRRRLKQFRKDDQILSSRLYQELENSKSFREARISEKSGFEFKLRYMASHLLTIEDRIKRKRRKHKRDMKKINNLTIKLANAEFKLAHFKALYFLESL